MIAAESFLGIKVCRRKLHFICSCTVILAHITFIILSLEIISEELVVINASRIRSSIKILRSINTSKNDNKKNKKQQAQDS